MKRTSGIIKAGMRGNLGVASMPALIAILCLLWFPTIAKAQNVILVNTIADLQALNTLSYSNYTVVFVSDYYSPAWNENGRGGGHFRWWTNRLALVNGIPPDGGHYILSTNPSGNTNGMWERLLEGEPANVKMWGAHGDGVTDDTQAISNAMYACGQVFNSTGQAWATELFFPQGVYLVTNTLIFSPDVHLRGEHVYNSGIVMKYGVNADILRTSLANSVLHGGTPDYDHGVQVENLFFLFQPDNPSNPTTWNTNNAALVVCQPGENNTIRNISTEYGGYGIRCLGTGAPGLRLRDVHLNNPAIAGVQIEALPGVEYDDGGPTSIIGISGDSVVDPLGIASLVKISNSLSVVEISDLKAEQHFGGGVIQWICASNTQFGSFGTLKVHNAFANTSGSILWPLGTTNFIVLKGLLQNQAKTPCVTLDDVRSYAANLIADYVSSNFVANLQGPCRVPIEYEATCYNNLLTNQVGQYYAKYNRCVVGNTAFSQFTPNQAGWYRVMDTPAWSPAHLAGNLVITSLGIQSTEIQVDDDTQCLCVSPWISLTRSSHDNSYPLVTQARVYHYWDSIANGPYACTDILVNLTNIQITLTHNVEGYLPSDGQVQLLSPPVWLGPNTNSTAYLPSGSTSSNIVLFR